MMKQNALKLAFLIALLISPGPAHATEILFAFVDNDGPYVDDGQEIAAMIAALPGFNVTERFLDAAIYNDYASFDQVWVYDLFTGPDDDANQMANYANIASWYNGLSDQNLIVDGRIISSASDWTTAGGFPPEDPWIQNYATQLDSVGGGLVLGTDHDAFQGGINEINAQINIDPFTGFFGTFPTSQALLDPLSPLFVPVGPCNDGTPGHCINDNSTTGFAPAGLQANGQFLAPAAYHGTISTAFDNAAVASTFASPTFPSPAPPTFALALLGLTAIGVLRRSS